MNPLLHLYETGIQMWSKMLFMFAYALFLLKFEDKLLLLAEKYQNKNNN